MPRRGRKARVLLHVINRTRGRLPSRKLLERAAELALAGGHFSPPAAVTLLCVGARRMIGLNGRFHSRHELTDVLSFPIGEIDEKSGRRLVGEVVICREVAAREATRRGLTEIGEMLLYAVHGWLHLAGYDDGTKQQRARMAGAERRILARLGFRRDG